VSPEERQIGEIKACLRWQGWYVRYTEWSSGHQVVIHRRSDPAVHRVTSWRMTELAAWREALSQALACVEVDMPIPIQEEPESTIGRKPPSRPHGEPSEVRLPRSGATIRREEADESEAGSEIRDRDRTDPTTIQGLEE
jgi:hypothetical protein